MAITSQIAKRIKASFLIQAWLVILLATCFGSLLAGAQILLSPVIEANKRNETRKHIPALVRPDLVSSGLELNGPKTVNTSDLEIKRHTIKGHKKSHIAYQALKQNKTIGWVVSASGQGYAGSIELLIGLGPQFQTYTGLYIIEQKETPGLGNKIIEAPWRKQFAGKPSARILTARPKGKKVSDTAGNLPSTTIDAITGATISSRSVCQIINQTVADLKEPLLKKHP